VYLATLSIAVLFFSAS